MFARTLDALALSLAPGALRFAAVPRLRALDRPPPDHLTAFYLYLSLGSALGSLFWMIWKTRREGEESLKHLRDVIESRNAQMREALSAFKLEVAKSYAAVSNLKDLESRLVGHLLRIESKLDVTALKTEALKAKE